jgi:hypothetical protein
MQPDHAPTPFSASEIRDGCPTGSWRSYRLSVLGPQGWSVTRQVTRFANSTADATDMEAFAVDADGNRVGEVQKAEASWSELQAHASFPQSATSIERVPVTLDCGQFDTWLYLVDSFEDGRRKEKRIWFALHLPGPPVYMEEWLDDELVFRMTLVDFGLQ